MMTSAPRWRVEGSYSSLFSNASCLTLFRRGGVGRKGEDTRLFKPDTSTRDYGK